MCVAVGVGHIFISLMRFYSFALFVHLLQTQLYCCVVNNTRDITLNIIRNYFPIYIIKYSSPYRKTFVGHYPIRCHLSVCYNKPLLRKPI